MPSTIDQGLREKIAAELAQAAGRPKEWEFHLTGADRILAIPEIAEALSRPKPFNPGYTVISGTGKGARKHVAPR